MWHLFGARKKKLQHKDDKAVRLPQNIKVHSCIVCFKPNLSFLTIEGSILMHISILENSKSLILNAVDLMLTKIVVEEEDTRNRQEPLEIKQLEKGQLELKFDPPLLPHKAQLRINFRGTMHEKKVAGFYRFKNTPMDPQYSFLVNFHPSDARKCFPAFDEPCMKSQFDICLIIPKDQTVIGNMPIKVRYHHKKSKKLEIIELKRTPAMSPNALGLVVGKFEFSEIRSADDEMNIRVYTRPEKKEQGEFTLKVAKNAVSFFQDYFSFPFPIPKLDFVVLSECPELNSCFGMILGRENQLLADEASASVFDRQRVAMNICELVSTQWIGNLVTIDWWNQLWLYCGLGKFLRYVCMEEILPEYETSMDFITDVLNPAMWMDGFKASHALDTTFTNVSDCEELFDDISYMKGAAVFRMLYNHMGVENFRAGLIKFVSTYQYNNFAAEDLWKCFEDVSSKPVVSLMNSWMTQKGFPIVRVGGKQDGRNRFIKVTQERFVYDQAARDRRSEGLWVIPLTATTARDPTAIVFQTHIETKSSTVLIPDIAKTDWIKINVGVTGFYRVKYSQDMLNMLIHGIKDKSLQPVDRLNILEDQFALLLAGVTTMIEILTLIEAFVDDENYHVWVAISSVFEKLMKLFEYINLENSVHQFGDYVYNRVLERVGYIPAPTEHHHDKLLRRVVLLMLVKFGHYDVLLWSKSMWEHYLVHGQPIPPDIKDIVYWAILNRGQEDVLKLFFKMYKEADSAQEKLRIAKAFEAVTDPPMIRQILDFAVSTAVRKPDAIDIILAVAKHKRGRDVAWLYFKENFTLFKTRYGTHLASKLIHGIIADFAFEENEIEVVEYFKSNITPGTEKAVQMGIESIRMNENLIRREKSPQVLQEYLEADAL